HAGQGSPRTGMVDEMSRRSGASAIPSPAHDAHLAGLATAAEEPAASIGFQSGDHRARRHAEGFPHFSALLVHAPQFALVAFPGAMPELAVEPGDAGDEAVGLDRAQHFAGVRIDLVDPAFAVVPDPQRAFGPGEAGVAAAGRCGNGAEHLAGPGIDLLDAR